VARHKLIRLKGGWRFHYIPLYFGGVGLDHALYYTRQLQDLVIHARFIQFIYQYTLPLMHQFSQRVLHVNCVMD